jgi:type IV pilus assembly protein PilY1
MQRTKAVVTIFLFLLLFFIPSIGHGLDTDLYVLTGVDVPPNVLIILDSSASMDDVVSGSDADYDPAVDYGPVLSPPAIAYPKDEIYVKSTGGKWVDTGYTTSSFPCSDPDPNNLVENYLKPFGQALNYSSSSCTPPINKKDFQTGNFRNFLQIGGPGGSRSRFGLANGIIHSYVNTTSGVRFGTMVFNRDSGIPPNVVQYDKSNPSKGEFVFGDSRDDPLDANGGKVIGFVDQNKNGKTGLFNNLSGLKNDTWSPLAETLLDAGTYFQFGKDGYSSPVQNYCQRNYVLIISDGTPTKDTGKLDEVAKYLYGIDMSKGKLSDKQNIKTYTIGFDVTNPLLESTARYGGGRYFYVYSSQSFNIAFQTFIAEVLKESTSYVAPVVPISQMERTSAGNRIYLAMFKPTERSFWKGNIKKYGIATIEVDKESSNYGELVDGNGNLVTDPSIKVGDILDAAGRLVMKPDNTIDPDARSYWSSEADGEDVEKGGVGKKLSSRTESRTIFTNLGNPDLTDGSNGFATTNAGITPEELGLSSGDTTGKNKIINFVHGLDSYDWEGDPVTGGPDGITNVNRSWILGAFIHSRPVVIHYNKDLTIIYAGGNDGMLHAFNDDDSGKEEWAFIPRYLLPYLKNLNGEALQFFVDGAPKAYIERDNDNNLTKGILIFGLRRGGNRYYALDITTYNKPKLLWEINPSTPGFGELGQTWGTPNIGRIQGWPNPVIFIGGGYDENQDNLPVSTNDTKGRGIYVIDIITGSLVYSYTYANNALMKYSIPSDIARVDTNGDTYIDRLYVGDVGGQVWRFDISESGLTGKVIFDSSSGESAKRKIFYSPDVTLEKENYEIIFFGTGDREHPKDTTKVDRLYAIKDKNPFSPLKESDLYDATADLLQTGDTTELAKLNASQGWYIKLNEGDHVGEKCLSNSVLFYGVVYYTTFQPTFGAAGDVCFLGEGIARLYAVDYRTGNAVFNLDLKNDLGGTVISRSDRSAELGVSIPSGVIVTFIGGRTVAYGGVGGGVYRPPLPSTRTIIPINWRIKF